MSDDAARSQIIERYAIVAAQLHHEQGDREALLKERELLIEQGRKLGLFQSSREVGQAIRIPPAVPLT